MRKQRLSEIKPFHVRPSGRVWGEVVAGFSPVKPLLSGRGQRPQRVPFLVASSPLPPKRPSLVLATVSRVDMGPKQAQSNLRERAFQKLPT